MLVSELNVYLAGNDINMNYWYDDAILICESILSEFPEKNWKILIDMIEYQNDIWNKRLVECLDEVPRNYVITIVCKIIETDNEDLFVTCVDCLRRIDITDLNIEDKINITDRVNNIINKSNSLVYKKVLKAFLTGLKC